MNTPPKSLDGAEVIEWAWSGSNPFGYILTASGEVAETVFGLAICTYPNSSVVYRFSCDENWEVVQDSDYASVDDAKSFLPEQYKACKANWHREK